MKVWQDPTGFDQWYAAYPRHTHRKAAEKAWQKLAPDVPLQEVIAQAVEVQKRTHAWRKDGGKFVPHPASWLNGERWQDEVETSAKAENPCGFGCPHDPSCRSPWDCLALRRAAGETL
jgi:hypothetical protein